MKNYLEMIYFRPLITKAKVDEDKYFPVYSIICCVPNEPVLPTTVTVK